MDAGPADRYAAGTFEFVSPLRRAAGLTAAPANGRVNLTWTGVAGALTYNAKHANYSGGPYTTFAAGLTGSSCSDTGLVNDATYYYIVSAAIANSEGPDSAEASATPSATNKLGGTLIGTAGSWSNQGSTKEKAVDGDIEHLL